MGNAAPVRWSSAALRWRKVWPMAALVLFLMSVATNGTFLRYQISFGPGAWGDLGAQMFDLPEPDGVVVVKDVRSTSPLFKLGIRDGDHLKFDRPWDEYRVLLTGERLGLTTIKAGQAPVHSYIVVPSRTPGSDGWSFGQIALIASRLFILCVGLFVLWRGRKDASVVLLGLAFLAYSTHPPFSHPLEPAVFIILAVYFFPIGGVGALLFLRFAMLHFHANTCRLRPIENYLFYGLVALQIATVPASLNYLLDLGGPIPTIFSTADGWLYLLTTLLSIIYLVRGLVASKSVAGRRYVLLLIALPLTFSSVTVAVFFSVLGKTSDSLQPVLSNVQVLGVMLFAYALFREKLFNLEFAVNRVLVYGIFSLLLLVSFGLLEWAAEKIIHFEGRESNAVLDAGLALLVFLVFHRVRDFVEHQIEALLFRRWQNNERALKDFIEDAKSFTRPEALVQAFIVELKRFGGTDAAYYVWDQNRYTIGGGMLTNAPTQFDTDDPLVLPLRARRKPIEPKDSRVGLALALPLTGYHDLPGFILLGSKPSGVGFRPDEVEVLGWATNQVGAMLHALKIEDLASSNRDLLIRYDETRAILASLKIVSPSV